MAFHSKAYVNSSLTLSTVNPFGSSKLNTLSLLLSPFTNETSLFFNPSTVATYSFIPSLACPSLGGA